MSTEHEARSRAEYMRAKRASTIQIYFKDEAEKGAFQQIAEASGYRNFSRWIVQILYNATTGQTYPAGYVEQLQADATKLRSWVETKDQQISELQRDLKLAETAREDLRVILAAVAHKVPEVQPQLRVAERQQQTRSIMTGGRS